MTTIVPGSGTVGAITAVKVPEWLRDRASRIRDEVGEDILGRRSYRSAGRSGDLVERSAQSRARTTTPVGRYASSVGNRSKNEQVDICSAVVVLQNQGGDDVARQQWRTGFPVRRCRRTVVRIRQVTRTSTKKFEIEGRAVERDEIVNGEQPERQVSYRTRRSERYVRASPVGHIRIGGGRNCNIRARAECDLR